MKIIELSIENVKRIRALTITPNGASVVLGGENEAGKTSTLDAITMALSGGKSIPASPIRKGQKKARVEVDLGDFIVERRFSASGGTTLEIRPKDGGPKFASPQAMLDKLFGNLSFDPLAFTIMKPVEKRKTLEEVMGIDFSELDQKREALYGERSFVNREVKALEGKVENLPKYPEVKQAVDIKAILAERDNATKHNEDLMLFRQEIEMLDNLMAGQEKEIESLRERAVELKRKISITQQQRQMVAQLITEPINTQPITDSLINAQELNDMVEANERRAEAEKELRGKRMDSELLTQAIQDVDSQKESMLAEAKFPVPGLAFGETGVLFNGIPFEQASEEQQIVVSAAMGLALNPTLRVLLVRKAALLDQKHMAALIQWGVDHDVQLWVEKVGDGKECTIIISDGMILEDRTNKLLTSHGS